MAWLLCCLSEPQANEWLKRFVPIWLQRERFWEKEGCKTRENKQLSYHRHSARCGCRSPQRKSIIYLSPLYNLRPVKSSKLI